MIKNLENTDPNVIVDCLHEAFSDYVVPMKMPHEYWINRWNAARIDYSLSFGYFDNGKLVGFVLHGIDNREGKLCFFNMGTGVIPSHRGQKIVKQIYDSCYHELLRSGCERGVLEVIQSNEKAIKSYKSVGFELELELISFNGRPLSYTHPYNFSEVIPERIERYLDLINHNLSWEHTPKTVMYDKSQFTFYEMHKSDETIGFAILKKSNNNVTIFGVKDGNWNKYGAPLFSEIQKKHPEFKIINIDTRDIDLINFFEENKFSVLIKQFEMKLEM